MAIILLLKTEWHCSAQTVYSANYDTDTVTAYDAATGSNIFTIANPGSGPSQVALAGTNLYVLDIGYARVGSPNPPSDLVAYNSTTGAQGSFDIPVGAPGQIATDGQNVCVSSIDGGAGVYNALSGAQRFYVDGLVVGSGPVADYNGGLYLGTYGYTTNLIEQFNVNTGAENYAFLTGIIWAFAFSGSNGFALDYSNNAILEFDTNTGAEGFQVTTGLNGPDDIAVSGTNLFVANAGNNTITAYSVVNGAPSFTISAGVDNPEYLTSYGNDLFAANDANDTITEYDATTGNLLQTIETGTNQPGTIVAGPVVVPEPDALGWLAIGFAGIGAIFSRGRRFPLSPFRNRSSGRLIR